MASSPTLSGNSNKRASMEDDQLAFQPQRRRRSTPSFDSFNILEGLAFDNYYDDLNEVGHPITPPRPSKRSRSNTPVTPEQRQSKNTHTQPQQQQHVSSLTRRALYTEGTVTVERSSSAAGLDPALTLSQLDALIFELNVEVDTETIRLGCLSVLEVINRRSIHPDSVQALQFSLFEYHCLLSQSSSQTAVLSTAIDPDQARLVAMRASTDSGFGEDGGDEKIGARPNVFALDRAEAVILRQNRIVGRLMELAAASGALPAKNLARVLSSPAALTKVVGDERVVKTRSLLLAFINILLVDVSSARPQSSDQLATLFEITQHSLIELTGARQAASGMWETATGS